MLEDKDKEVLKKSKVKQIYNFFVSNIKRRRNGEAWGQDYRTQTIPTAANQIMNGNNNVLFSIHVYDQWNGRNIGQYFDTVQSQGIPIIVSEYGSTKD
ncbi:MAG: glycoside hydrolase family 5 protein [Hydrococcus sp. RU_2_2]|nr:glycoside hydrolase family 5 protein [Hydrococcus sp. RU_2_2]NJP22567.1 glycoside hydrolase family 5 protein [Hydrococcus sp. CRU_1_1]